MTSRKIVAVFDSSESAQTARTRLIEKGVPRDRITIADQGSWGERKLETPHARVSFWTHVKEMFMPEHDRHTYEESLRRGGYLLVATGRAEVMTDAKLSLWDAAALYPAITEAGGVFTDWTGSATPFGGSAIATNAALADEVRAILMER